MNLITKNRLLNMKILTTNDLLWNATFERSNQPDIDTYNYFEEWNMERYYEDKDLFERLSHLIRPAV